MRATVDASEAVWQDVECGVYKADIPLWLKLADQCGQPSRVLDLGAGVGRVSLELARAGHAVTALDLSESLLAGLRDRAACQAVGVRTVAADVRTFDLGERFDLVIAPMQLVQLLPTARDRRLALARVRDHLRPGGLGALAILDLGELAREEATGDDYALPRPDVLELDGWAYSSQPVAMRLLPSGRGPGALELDRVRRAVAPDGAAEESLSRVRLAGASPGELDEVATAVGLVPEQRRRIGPTRHHVASVVVILRKPEAG